MDFYALFRSANKHAWPIAKTIRILKLTTVLLIAICLQVSATVYPQKVTLKETNVPIQKIFEQIRKQTSYQFFYTDEVLDKAQNVSINIKKAGIDEVLDICFQNQQITYTISGNTIIVRKKIPAQEVYTQPPAPPIADVQGKVVDDKGEPLIGATIFIKGTSNGTKSDADGNFTISAQPNSTLVISYIGFESAEVKLGSRLTILVQLKPAVSTANEIVVIGYGRQNRRNVTGAVSQLNTSEVKDIPVSNIGQKLQGKFAGVQVYQTSGEPNGGGMTYRVRGQTSITAGNSPLVVIDGFPTVSGMETLSPDEIESISVLKDASAASLYGSRAANGVILITTKSAKSGVTEIALSSYYGIESVSDRGKPNMMNAREFAQFKKETYEDMAIFEGYTGGVPEQYQNPDQVKDGTDWFDILLRNAATQNYNLSVSKGTDRLRSSLNFNYNKQEGVILNTYNERFAVRTNNVLEATDKLTLGLNIAGSYINSQVTPGLGNGRNIIGSSLLMDPALKYRNDDGTYPLSFSPPGMFQNANYYLVVTQRKNPVKRASVIANAFAEYEILKNLKYKLSLNANMGNNVNESFTPSSAQGGMFSAPPQPATGSYSAGNFLTWLVENTLTYSKTFNTKHNVDALVGYASQKTRSQSATIAASNFPDDAVDWFNAATVKTGTGNKTAWSLLSFIGRLNYNYDSKYLMSMAFRRDGSSRFGSNAKWGIFPSVSLGWILTEENFLRNNDKLSFLKLRASYGKVGNNNIGDYSYVASVTSSNYVFNNTVDAGRALSSIGNNELTWETTKQFNLGFDLGLFNNRIYFTYDYYLKNTSGLLYVIDIPRQSGFTNIQANIGEFKFWGHEFSVETKNFTGAFRWNTNINLTVNRNKAIRLGTNNTPIGGYNPYWDWNRTQVGHPIGEFMGFIQDGVYMTQEEFDTQPKHISSNVGTVRYKDVSGPDNVPDGVIDIYDKTIVGNPTPDFLYGMTNEFSYRNFDASVVISGAVGGDIYNGITSWTDGAAGIFNITKDWVDRWRSPENPGKGRLPRTMSSTISAFTFDRSGMVSDNSFLAVKNITLGYTLGIKANRYIKSTRFYIGAQNIFYLMNYEGMNPEVSSSGSDGLRQGIDFSSYPISKIYTLGVNVRF